MENYNVESLWEKYADEVNKNTLEGLERDLKFYKGLSKELDSYDLLINKCFREIVKEAGLEKGKIYYAQIPYSKNYLTIDISEDGDFYLRGYEYKDTFPYVGELISKPLQLKQKLKLFTLMSLYFRIKNEKGFSEILKKQTCKHSSRFYLNILLDNKRIESIYILPSGTPTKYGNLTVRYLSDLMSDESKSIPFILELKGWKEEHTLNYYIKEDRSLCLERGSFKNFSLLTKDKLNKFFVLFYDFDLGEYSRYLRKTTKLNPRTLFLVKMLECLGITFEIEENVNLDKLIVD